MEKSKSVYKSGHLNDKGLRRLKKVQPKEMSRLDSVSDSFIHSKEAKEIVPQKGNKDTGRVEERHEPMAKNDMVAKPVKMIKEVTGSEIVIHMNQNETIDIFVDGMIQTGVDLLHERERAAGSRVVDCDEEICECERCG
ncbi:hypothetical protein Tco_0374135 [Tanacetum coccineum]